tara:strand:- start:5722 stop:7494 length:1773 start_codon:yes stop_codon:yes gene_type:complete
MNDREHNVAERVAPVTFNAQVFADGRVQQPQHSVPAGMPAALVDLALGFLFEELTRVEFLWADARTARLLNVTIERSPRGDDEAAHVSADWMDVFPLRLTRRELDVATLLVGGLSNADIAEALGVGARTVTTHVDHVMRKFGVSSRSAAATAALDAGIIVLPFLSPAAAFERLRLGRMVRSAGRRSAKRPHGVRLSANASPLLIGALIPLHGRAHHDAVEMLNGATLALEEINRRGGLHGRELRMSVEEVDADDSASTRRAVGRLLRQHPGAITSGYLADQHTALEAASGEGMPFLHASASVRIARMVAGDEKRFRGAFQFSPNDSDYAPGFVSFLTELRDSGLWSPSSRRIAVVHQSRWEIVDLGLLEASARAADAGWELQTISVNDRIDASDSWAVAARAAQRADLAAVMIGSYFPADNAQFIRAFRSAPGSALIYSSYAPSVPIFRAMLREAAEGVVWATTTGTYSDNVGKAFARRYAQRFSRPPGRSHAGIAYDRIHILAQAWGQVNDPDDFDRVSARLLDTRYRGVNGAYTFDPKGHSTLRLSETSTDPSLTQAHATFQIQDGRNVLLAPTPYAAGVFLPPPWCR